jgi:hypothetical protein
MAAKKKSTRKKVAKKKVASKPKKAAKKKAAKNTKKASKPKKSPKAKKISVRKVAGKKKALKRAKPIGMTVPKGPSIAPMEAPAIEVQSMNINALFLLGLGQITATLIRSGQEIGSEPLDHSGSIQFPDVRSRDVIAISGSCSGTAEITADRPTVPATPRKFKEQQILDLLKVK